MAKTANINIRIEPEIKAKVENLFADLGMTVTEAVNIFFHKALLDEGLPFEVKMPRYNAETLAAMQEAEDIISGKIETKTYNSAHEFTLEMEAEMAEEVGD